MKNGPSSNDCVRVYIFFLRCATCDHEVAKSFGIIGPHAQCDLLETLTSQSFSFCWRSAFSALKRLNDVRIKFMSGKVNH